MKTGDDRSLRGWRRTPAVDSPVLRFSPGDEALFLQDYRLEGLRWSSYACLAGIIVLVLFVVFPGLSNRYTAEATFLRILLVFVLVSIQFALWRFQAWAVRHYFWLVGGGCIAVLSGLLWLILDPQFESVSSGFSVLPVAMFFIFLLYGFLRLPIVFALFLGGVFSAAISFVVYAETPGDGWYRVVLYLGLQNVLGGLLLVSIESRERQVFRQSLALTASKAAALIRAESAERAYEDKIRLISAINHDLRQPLLAINAHAGLIGRRVVGPQPDSVGLSVRNLGEAVQFLNIALDNLLAAARYESGDEPVNVERVLVSDLVTAAVDIISVDALSRGLEIRVRLPSFRVELSTDRASMIRVLINLISNALKFTEVKVGRASGVVIFVGFRRGVCKIAVADTGIGIPEEHLSVIFEPYSKAGRAVLGRDSGLGLGLFLVRAALNRLHGHSVDVRSRVSRGSRFTVSVPGKIFLGASNREICVADLDEGLEQSLGGSYVLLLEKSDAKRQAMIDVLEDWGVLVSSAASVQELIANETESERTVDSLLVGLDGLDALSQVDLLRLKGLLPAGVNPIFTSDSGAVFRDQFLPGSNWKILRVPFAPQDLALAILAGVEENRRRETEE
ncbi:MAG: HAMP domain-containing sensor histidine kinase [Verrucomicrobia bacterium]|nr:HAMP domain-containing sensor histidine kinase [Verrucomicrobiota bacterium]